MKKVKKIYVLTLEISQFEIVEKRPPYNPAFCTKFKKIILQSFHIWPKCTYNLLMGLFGNMENLKSFPNRFCKIASVFIVFVAKFMQM